MLLLKRVIAASIHFSLLLGVAVVALLLDEKADVLFGYDGLYLGYSLLAGLSLLLDCALKSDPLVFRLLGLRLSTRTQAAVPRPIRAVRGLVLFVMLASPTTFPGRSLFRSLPLSTREQIIGMLTVGLLVMLLPAVTVLATGGRTGIHDRLTGTRVVGRNGVSAQMGRAGSFGGSHWRRVVAATALAWAVILSCAMVADWRSRISDHFTHFWRQQLPRMSRVVASPAPDALRAFDFVFQQAAAPHYYDATHDIFLRGQTQYLRFRVPYATLADFRARTVASYDAAIASYPILEPQTKWLAFDLFAQRLFGPLVRDYHYRFLLDAENGKLKYAPTKETVTPVEGSKDSVWIHTEYEPELRGWMGVRTLGWRFPSLDFTSHRSFPVNKLVGR